LEVGPEPPQSLTDDKIVGVLENDYVWGAARDVSNVPSVPNRQIARIERVQGR
jgi:hypothetical protein